VHELHLLDVDIVIFYETYTRSEKLLKLLARVNRTGLSTLILNTLLIYTLISAYLIPL